MKKGAAKKAKEKQSETPKNKQKMPFSRGENQFFVLTSQEKENKKKENTYIRRF